MRLSRLFLGASMLAIALPGQAQTVPPTVPVAAQAGRVTTLRDALVTAYNTSPELAGARANLRATDENVPIARAAALPSAQLSGTYGEDVYDSSDPASQGAASRSLTGGVNLAMPIYRGGGVRNNVRAAKTRVEAGRADLRTTESQVFTDVVSAYMDVMRNEAVVRLNQENTHVLEVNLQATRDRFEVGDLTRTDVAQSEARLALAQSQLQSAQAQLIASRETYIRVVGVAPGNLAAPPALPNLPGDTSSAVSVALDQNPALEAAHKASDASAFDVKAARAGRLPQVSLTLGNSYYNYLGSVGSPAIFGPNDGLSTSAGVQLSMPLYQGGAPSARIRQAQARQSAAIEQATLTERGVIAQARSAFAVWQSAQRVIESSKVAVEANRLSLEGVRAENSVGTRTILDILNAEQELLNSQVQYVTAQRDAYVAGFALLAAMGKAEAEDLGLDGGPLYDPVAHYKKVSGNINDWSDQPAPQPVGTRTNQSPAQTPAVGPDDGSDPVLQRPVDTTTPNPSGN